MQHWDDPGSNAQVMNYDEETTGAATYAEEEGHQEEEQEDEESRYLTHEEIWDDSALIDAWNSATAEYEVCSTDDSRQLVLTNRLYCSHSTAKARNGKKSQ